NWPNYARFGPLLWTVNAPTMPTNASLSLQRFPDGWDTNQPSDWVVMTSSPGQPPPPTPTPTGTATNTATPTGTPGAASPTPTPTVYCIDAYEPDNVPSQIEGRPANVLQLGTEQTHVICPDRDEDWMKINVTDNKVYKIFTADLGGGLDTILA